MNTELTVGAINPGYGGLPIGVAAALGGATLAWHAHPGQGSYCPARTVMRYHHPHAGEHNIIDVIPPMVDVLTVNGYDTWEQAGVTLVGAGYKPSVIIAEVRDPNYEAVTICEILDAHGYKTAWQNAFATNVGAPHQRYRPYVVAVRKDCDTPAVNAAYLSADPWLGSTWPTPSAYNTHLDVDAYRWSQDDLEGHANKALTRALEHWEKVTGERYPYPLYSLPTTTDAGRLFIGFVEWMMGLPIGYVSTPSLRLSHDDRMGLLYSGTVPLQAAYAVAVVLKQMDDR